MDKKEEFIKAIGNNKGLIYKVAAIYTNSAEDRNDLMQEIIYQVWKSFGSFNQQSLISTWMYRVAMNTAIYHLKSSKRKIKTLPIDEYFIDTSDTDNNDYEEKWKLLRQHINHLNLLDRGIVLLYLENKSYEEIAVIIGISASNVGTRLSRIKEKLRTQVLKQL